MNDFALGDASLSKEIFLHDVLEGLRLPQKSIPCKYFYDRHGSKLFEQICELPEYYLTRTELDIMRQFSGEMARCLRAGCVIVEFGSGSSLKTQILLKHLNDPKAYVPVDISENHLLETARQLGKRNPEIPIKPVCADFSKPFALPQIEPPGKRTVVYFPGSTIGNFGPEEATQLLRAIRDLSGEGGGLLIGFDLKKSKEILEPAYNDKKGVTAEFNLNVLKRINRELDADFQIENFRHHAFFNETESHIEMHLISETDQTVRIGGTEIHFHCGETIHTENSYKYSTQQFGEIASQAGFLSEKSWMDSQELFCVQYLRSLTEE